MKKKNKPTNKPQINLVGSLIDPTELTHKEIKRQIFLFYIPSE